ncbi:aspartyl-phosphate phosphatase Spo0E family protein [Brevibacillus laterosporus]|nr:aspartyl-phosphate phosphatase Spo0E family protein [Brevibacillus laterosporus]
MKKILLVFLFLIGTTLAACSRDDSYQEIYLVKNEGTYETYVGKNHQDIFLLNLALNYSPSLPFDQSEVLRQKLEMLYYKEGSFSSRAILQMSQQLDEYIVTFQKLQYS